MCADDCYSDVLAYSWFSHVVPDPWSSRVLRADQQTLRKGAIWHAFCPCSDSHDFFLHSARCLLCYPISLTSFCTLCPPPSSSPWLRSSSFPIPFWMWLSCSPMNQGCPYSAPGLPFGRLRVGSALHLIARFVPRVPQLLLNCTDMLIPLMDCLYCFVNFIQMSFSRTAPSPP